MPPVADGELSGVHTDSDAAGTGSHIVTRERTLPSLIEAPRRGERERMRRDYVPGAKVAAQRVANSALRAPRNASPSLAYVRRAASTLPPTR